MKDKHKKGNIDKTKIEEPFDPQRTPPPPQDIDPSRRNENNEPDMPVENSRKTPDKKSEKSGNTEKSKQVGDELEITDENTI